MRIEFLLAVANAKTSVSRRLVLAQDQCAIGRQEGDVRLSDTLVSRMHAIIYFDGRGELRIKDLDSTNGTFVNDARIQDQALHRGDEVRIGDTSIVLVQAEPHQGRQSPITEAPEPVDNADRPTAEHRRPGQGVENLSYIRHEETQTGGKRTKLSVPNDDDK